MRATSLARVGTTRISAIARRRRSFCTVIGERTRWTALAVLFLSPGTISRAEITSMGDVEFVPHGENIHLYIGQASDGQLRIDGGTDLSVQYTQVGETSGNIAALDVVGTGTRLNISGGFEVNGFGRLRVLDGGFVSSYDLVNSSRNYGVSLIELAGEGTTHLIRGHITLGQVNQASLYVRDGAVVDAGTARGYLGEFSRIKLDGGNLTLRDIDLSGYLGGTGKVSVPYGRFRNKGTIEAGSSLTLETRTLENEGLIEVGNGTLILQGLSYQIVDNFGTIDLRGGNLHLNTVQGFGILNYGELIASNDDNHIHANVLNTGTVRNHGGLNIHGDLSNSGVVRNLGQLHVYGDLSNDRLGVVELTAGLGIVDGDFSSRYATITTEFKERDSFGKYGALQVGGEARFVGKNTLQMSAPRRYEFELGDTFDVLTAAGGITGDLMLGDMPDLDESLSWHLSSDSSALTLSVVLAGDFNGDQSVDLADYVVWRNMQGGRGAYLAADASGPLRGPDGVVDQWDYGVWKANFGASAADFAASRPSDVPEPAACTLLVIASKVCFAARA